MSTHQLNRRVFAIIPARGGSKGVARKNIRELDAKPLIAYSIESAKNAKLVTQLYVSTEDREIADLARKYGASVIDRPAHLASDEAQNDAVMIHAIESLQAFHSEDYIILLQPTSPLRKSQDIDACISILIKDKSVKSVISVTDIDHHPGKMVIISNGQIIPYTNTYEMEERRQNLQTVFRQNGAIYAMRALDFLKHKSFYVQPCYPHKMNKEESIDIDSIYDFRLAEFILTHPKAEKAP